MRDDPPEPQLAPRDAAYLAVVRRLTAAVAASQPFSAAAEFAQAAAQHPGGEPPSCDAAACSSSRSSRLPGGTHAVAPMRSARCRDEFSDPAYPAHNHPHHGLLLGGGLSCTSQDGPCSVIDHWYRRAAQSHHAAGVESGLGHGG